MALGVVGYSQAIAGIITGRVEDSSGARIPDVSITLTSPAIEGEGTFINE